MDIPFYALIGVIVFQVLVICLTSLMGHTSDPDPEESTRTFGPGMPTEECESLDEEELKQRRWL